ncbi:PAS domain S-box protein [Paenibacillus antri]|uniref:PAS domain S-box protein n=1 Tax=Paenibacillus antri TaxID=2582848 RepID=A0A5R9GCB8_9BACL|nr:PAS domain S-box protein [Paenibacillus antri]TLS51976.1 PAS domain S-box protein [Paenibacillus antri]
MEILMIVASFAFAVGCSYFALSITAKSTFKLASVNLGLMLIASVVMGTGSWAMHYVAMLTVRFEGLEMTYSAPLVFISLFVPILSAYAALVPVSLPLSEGVRSFIGTVVVTMGVSSLHLIGMSALQMNAVLAYDHTLLLAAILFALTASHVGFRLFNYERFRRTRFRIAWSSLWLGGSMVGMHFLAIAGSTAIPIGAMGAEAPTGIDEGNLFRTVVVVLCVMFTLTLAAYHFARRAGIRLEALLESETLYSSIFAGAMNAILVLRPDPALTIADVNDQACKLLGKSKQELSEAPLGQVVPEHARRFVNDGPHGREEEWDLTSAEGGVRLAQAITGLVEIDEFTRYRVTFLRDITSLRMTRMITGVFRPLSLLTISGMPSDMLLPILQHLTPTLFPHTAIRFDPAPAAQTFEPIPSAVPRTREIILWDGTLLGRLTLTRKSEQGPDPDGMEEVWLDKCADLLEISISGENGAQSADNGLDTLTGVVNEELKFEYVGHTAGRLLGYEPEELENGSLLELYHPDDLKMFLLRVRRSEDLKTPYRHQVRLRHKEGSWVDFHMIIAASVRQEHAKIVFMAQRTAEKRAFGFRYDENEKYDFLFDHHPGPVVCIGLDGRFLKVNRELESLTGYRSDELLGESFEKVVWAGDIEKTRAHVEKAANGGASSYEIRIRRKDGRVVPLQVTNFPAVEGAEVMGVFGISIDATSLGRGAAENGEKEGDDGEAADDQAAKMTKREKEVIRLINYGMSNKEIATELAISENTVKNHISNIFAKLSISDRNQVPMLPPDCPSDRD